MEYEPVMEQCVIECNQCGRYKVTALDDECPSVCDHCCTPGLRIISREPVISTNWFPLHVTS